MPDMMPRRSFIMCQDSQVSKSHCCTSSGLISHNCLSPHCGTMRCSRCSRYFRRVGFANRKRPATCASTCAALYLSTILVKSTKPSTIFSCMGGLLIVARNLSRSTSAFSSPAGSRPCSGRGPETCARPASCHPLAGRHPNSGNTSTSLRDPLARELQGVVSVLSIASLQSATGGYLRSGASIKSNTFYHLQLNNHRHGRFPLADVQRVPGASHTDVEKPDHRIPLGPVLLVGGVAGWAEIRKKKDDVRLAEETAEALGVSPRTVRREWATAKLWLHAELSQENVDVKGTFH